MLVGEVKESFGGTLPQFDRFLGDVTLVEGIHHKSELGVSLDSESLRDTHGP